MNCPLCSSKNTILKFMKNEYRILHCPDCDHLFTDFSPTPADLNEIYSDDYFFNGKAGYADYTQEKGLLISRGAYYADKLRPYIAPGKVLDIGAAAGFILKGFENKGWTGTGIEPNQSMVDYGINEMGVNLKRGTLETIELEDKFDLILLVQVIAHMFDLHSSIKKICKFLKPGGMVLIETWDKNSFTAKIFGQHWHEYSPPGPLHYFSKKTLSQLMGMHGFYLAGQGTPKKKIHSKHAKSLLKYKLEESKLKWLAGFTYLIPGNMILRYPSEDLFWGLFKKN